MPCTPVKAREREFVPLCMQCSDKATSSYKGLVCRQLHKMDVSVVVPMATLRLLVLAIQMTTLMTALRFSELAVSAALVVIPMAVSTNVQTIAPMHAPLVLKILPAPTVAQMVVPMAETAVPVVLVAVSLTGVMASTHVRYNNDNRWTASFLVYLYRDKGRKLFH